jgi:hypothetical protein
MHALCYTARANIGPSVMQASMAYDHCESGSTEVWGQAVWDSAAG